MNLLFHKNIPIVPSLKIDYLSILKYVTAYKISPIAR